VGESCSSSSDGATTSSSASSCGLLIPGSLLVEYLDPERFSWRLGREVCRFLRGEEEEDDDDGAAFRFVRS
jgi:hypothetical protein